MDAITFLRNEANNHRLMQVDLDLLAKDEELLEDFYDILSIELRKSEESVSWEEAKRSLQQPENG